MSRWDQDFTDHLTGKDAAGLYRRLVAGRPGEHARLHRQGHDLINFSSNDYLGLTRHPALAERAALWAREFGTGAAASRLVCGTLTAHAEVERKLARFKGTEAALLLPAGWQANVSVLAALARLAGRRQGCKPALFADALIHSSLHHGARLAGIKPFFFRHNDIAHLRDLLHTHGQGTRNIIVSESVFSMDGDRADLAGLLRLGNESDAFLYIDEAHATGVLGDQGRGLCHGQAVDLVMGTLGKALGGFGAYVAGSRALIDYLINECAGFVFTTAPPPPVLGALDAALDLLPAMDAERQRVARYADQLRQALHGQGIDTAHSTTHIVPAIIGDERAALAVAQHLERQGILGVAIRPPTVPAGTSRIRLSLSAAHLPQDIDRLIAAMAGCAPATTP